MQATDEPKQPPHADPPYRYIVEYTDRGGTAREDVYLSDHEPSKRTREYIVIQGIDYLAEVVERAVWNGSSGRLKAELASRRFRVVNVIDPDDEGQLPLLVVELV
jgi:hypothetical protein